MVLEGADPTSPYGKKNPTLLIFDKLAHTGAFGVELFVLFVENKTKEPSSLICCPIA